MKNDVKLTLRVNAQDMALLKSHTKATRLSQSAYIHSLIHSRVPKAYPPEPFFQVMPALYQIAGDMTTIAATAQVRGEINAQEYLTISNGLFAKILKIEEAVIEPETITDG